jgi:hypothetical protein
MRPATERAFLCAKFEEAKVPNLVLLFNPDRLYRFQDLLAAVIGFAREIRQRQHPVPQIREIDGERVHIRDFSRDYSSSSFFSPYSSTR